MNNDVNLEMAIKTLLHVVEDLRERSNEPGITEEQRMTRKTLLRHRLLELAHYRDMLNDPQIDHE